MGRALSNRVVTAKIGLVCPGENAALQVRNMGWGFFLGIFYGFFLGIFYGFPFGRRASQSVSEAASQSVG